MNAPSPAFRAIVREKQLWLLLAAVAIFFYEPLTTGTFYARDIYLLFYAHKSFLAQAFVDGRIPLWDPLFHGGQPFVAEPANSFYYPSTLLFAVLPTIIAFNLSIVIQYALCAATAYFLGRTLRLSPWAAFVCGTVYAFCGYTLSAANLTVLVLAMPWPPLLLASTHRFMESRRTRWLVVAAFAGALPLLAGAAEYAAMSFGIVALWSLVMPVAPLSRRLRDLGLILFFAAALSAAQLVPASEVIRNSSRAMKRDYATFVQWSVHPHRLPELVVPQFFGPTNRAARSEYWGGRFELLYPYILSIYFGVPAMLLAAFGAIRGQMVSRRGRVLLASLAIAGFVLSIGGWLPFFGVIYDWVPFISIFRFPVKAMLLCLMPIAVLAGCGAEALRLSRRGVLIAAACCSGALMLVALLLGTSAWFSAAFSQRFFLQILPQSSISALARSFVHAGIAAGLLAIVLTVRRLAPERLIAFAAAIVLADLALAGFSVNSYAPREIFTRPPLAETVQRLTARGGRLYRAPSPYVTAIRPPADDVVWPAWWELQLLGRYAAGNWGIPTIYNDDYDGLAPIRISRVTDTIRAMPWPAKMPLLSAAGVTAILTPDSIAWPGVVRVGTFRNSDGKPLYLYANRFAQRVRIATTAELARDDADAFRRLASRPFDPLRVIITAPTAPTVSSGCPSQLLSVSAARPETVSVDSNAPCPVWIVFSDTFYPGWTASIDGHAARIEVADYGFSAVRVPAGRHTVKKVYRPRLIREGLLVSVCAAILLGVTAAALRLRPLGSDSRISPPDAGRNGIHQGS